MAALSLSLHTNSFHEQRQRRSSRQRSGREDGENNIGDELDSAISDDNNDNDDNSSVESIMMMQLSSSSLDEITIEKMKLKKKKAAAAKRRSSSSSSSHHVNQSRRSISKRKNSSSDDDTTVDSCSAGEEKKEAESCDSKLFLLEQELPECPICLEPFDTDFSLLEKKSAAAAAAAKIIQPIKKVGFDDTDTAVNKKDCSDNNKQQQQQHQPCRLPVSCTACSAVLCYACIVQQQQSVLCSASKNNNHQSSRQRRFTRNDYPFTTQTPEFYWHLQETAEQDARLRQRKVSCPLCTAADAFDVVTPNYNRPFASLLEDVKKRRAEQQRLDPTHFKKPKKITTTKEVQQDSTNEGKQQQEQAPRGILSIPSKEGPVLDAATLTILLESASKRAEYAEEECQFIAKCLDDERKTLETAHRDYHRTQRSLQIANEQLKTLEADLQLATIKIKQAEYQYEIYELEFATCKQKWRGRIDKVEQQYQEVQKQLEYTQHRAVTAETDLSNTKQVLEEVQYNKAVSQLELVTCKQTFQKQIQELQEQRSTLQEHLDRTIARAKMAETELEKTKQVLSEAKDRKVQLKEEFRTVIRQFQEEKDVLEANNNVKQRRLEQTLKRAKVAEHEWDKTTQYLRDQCAKRAVPTKGSHSCTRMMAGLLEKMQQQIDDAEHIRKQNFVPKHSTLVTVQTSLDAMKRFSDEAHQRAETAESEQSQLLARVSAQEAELQLLRQTVATLTRPVVVGIYFIASMSGSLLITFLLWGIGMNKKTVLMLNLLFLTVTSRLGRFSNYDNDDSFGGMVAASGIMSSAMMMLFSSCDFCSLPIVVTILLVGAAATLLLFLSTTVDFGTIMSLFQRLLQQQVLLSKGDVS